MLEFGFFVVSLLLVLVSVRLHEAITELKRLKESDRMKSTLGALLDAKHRALTPTDRQEQAINFDSR